MLDWVALRLIRIELGRYPRWMRRLAASELSALARLHLTRRR